MHKERIKKEIGRAEIIPQDPVKVRQIGTWKIIFRAGRGGINRNGSVRITVPHGFSIPQEKAFFEPGFVTVENLPDNRSPPLEFKIKTVHDIFCRLDEATGHSGAWGRSVFVYITNRKMEENEGFILTYGNRDYYGDLPYSKNGAVARELSGIAEFTVAVDPFGDRRAPYSGYIRLSEQPYIEILPGDPSDYILTVDPNRHPVGNGENSEINGHIVILDAYFNPIGYKDIKLPGNTVLDPQGHRFITEYGGRMLESNPLMPDNIPDCFSGYKLFWGDIHGHTIFSDGLGTPEEYFVFAEKVAHLDFSAVTDHDDIGPGLSEEEWEATKRAVKKYNKPGRFVTFLGYEYRNMKCDMCVYFPEGNGRVFYGKDPDYCDPKKLGEEVKKFGGMIIPHMHFGADLSGFDPELYRVMEIYSSHGAAEYRGCPREIPYLVKQVQKSSENNRDAYFHRVLEMGMKLGVTAGSDTHSGRPGLSDWTRVTRTYRGGLTGVFAEQKTPESIWAALYNRRCYATTGNRSILFFHTSGYVMGTTAPADSDNGYLLEFEIYADGTLREVTLFGRGGRKLISEEISGSHHMGKFGPVYPHTGDWFYVRYELKNGEMVWSSPIWFD